MPHFPRSAPRASADGGAWADPLGSQLALLGAAIERTKAEMRRVGLWPPEGADAAPEDRRYLSADFLVAAAKWAVRRSERQAVVRVEPASGDEDEDEWR